MIPYPRAIGAAVLILAAAGLAPQRQRPLLVGEIFRMLEG